MGMSPPAVFSLPLRPPLPPLPSDLAHGVRPSLVCRGRLSKVHAQVLDRGWDRSPSEARPLSLPLWLFFPLPRPNRAASAASVAGHV